MLSTRRQNRRSRRYRKTRYRAPRFDAIIYIDTIALALADRCYYYTLYFTAVDPTAYDKTPKKDEINISIYGASGMYDMTKEERLDAMRNMLKDRPVFVRDGDRADTFIISTKQESREKRRQKVLDKLTAEERELLGV